MKNIEFSYRNLRALAFGYLLLPVLLFLLFFVKLIISVPVALILVAVYLVATKESNGDDLTERKFSLPKRLLWILLVLCALWCFLGGQSGLYFQTADWNERNAILRDLITHAWPVRYLNTDTVLVYYIGHWLPAALGAKVLFAFTNNLGLCFAVGNILLAIWTLIGVMITLMLSFFTVNPKTKKGMWLVFALLVGFSGMDIIGCIIKQWSLESYFTFLHLEWWTTGAQISSNTTCLFWVFNQAVTAWIATLCFANEKTNRNYVFLVSTSLLSSTLPCVGLAILMVGKAGTELIKNIKQSQWKSYVKSTFSFSNIACLLTWTPIICLYLISNSAFEKTGSTTATKQWALPISLIISIIIVGIVGVAIGIYWLIMHRKGNNKSPFILGCSLLLIAMAVFLTRSREITIIYFLFIFLEFGIHWLLLADENYKDPLFYIMAFTIIIAPCIRVGIGADYCMRSTIPAVTLLVIACGKKLVPYIERNRKEAVALGKKVCCIILAVVLIIGAFTPAMEIYRGIHKSVTAQKIVQPYDLIKTLDQYHSSGGIYGNFVSDSYENSLFFKYLAQD